MLRAVPLRYRFAVAGDKLTMTRFSKSVQWHPRYGYFRDKRARVSSAVQGCCSWAALSLPSCLVAASGGSDLEQIFLPLMSNFFQMYSNDESPCPSSY